MTKPANLNQLHTEFDQTFDEDASKERQDLNALENLLSEILEEKAPKATHQKKKTFQAKTYFPKKHLFYFKYRLIGAFILGAIIGSSAVAVLNKDSPHNEMRNEIDYLRKEIHSFTQLLNSNPSFHPSENRNIFNNEIIEPFEHKGSTFERLAPKSPS